MGMTIGVVGKGALGLLLGSIAQQQDSVDNVTFLMDEERLKRHKNDVYTINGEAQTFTDVTPDKASPVDMLLIAVKSPSLSAALELAAPAIGPETVILPLLNGITSESKTAAVYGWEKTVGCVSYGMDAARYGCSLVYTQPGALNIGALRPESQRATDKAHELLTAAGINHEVCTDVRHKLWAKFMANVGINQVTAVFEMNYSQLFADCTSEAFRTYIGAMREVMAVGRFEGVELTEADMNAYIDVLLDLDPSSRPSMAQDRINHSPSEVEEFSGEVIRLASKHGLQVPCNKFFFQRVKEYEALY